MNYFTLSFFIFLIIQTDAFVYDLNTSIVYLQKNINDNTQFGQSVALFKVSSKEYLCLIGTPFLNRSINLGTVFNCPIKLGPNPGSLCSSVGNGDLAFGRELTYDDRVENSKMIIESPSSSYLWKHDETPQFNEMDVKLNFGSPDEESATKPGPSCEIAVPGADNKYKWLFLSMYHKMGVGVYYILGKPYILNHTEHHSYAGSSVSIGRLTNDKDTLILAIGAPGVTTSASNEDLIGSGAVIFRYYAFDYSLPNKLLGVLRHNVSFGSAFGFSVQLIDINNDGFDDLLVGAPYNPEELTESNQIFLTGRVYLYLHHAFQNGHPGIQTNQGNLPFIYPPQVIKEKLEDTSESFIQHRFGYKIIKLGDINNDKFQDFLITAPLAMFGGCVYIYLGNEAGNITRYSQRICGNEFSPKLLGFGMSAFGGLDIDDNGVKDIAVGAPVTGAAVVLRGRPVVKFFPAHLLPRDIVKNYTLDIETLPKCGERFYCMNLTITVFYQFVVNHSCDKTSVEYNGFFNLSLDSDVKDSQFIRVSAADDKIGGDGSFITGNITAVCRQKVAKDVVPENLKHYITVKFRKSPLLDYLSPVKFDVKYSFHLPPPGKPNFSSLIEPPSLDEYPVYDSHSTFDKEILYLQNICRPDRKCHPDLQWEWNFLNMSKEGDVYVKYMDTLDTNITLFMKLRNIAEGELAEAHQTFLHISSSDKENLKFDYAAFDEDEVHVYDLANPLKSGEEVTKKVTIRYQPSKKMRHGITTINFFISTNRNSPLKKELNTEIQVIFKLILDIQTSLIQSSSDSLEYARADTIAANAIDTASYAGKPLNIRFDLSYKLHSHNIQSSRVVIDWPWEISGDIDEPRGKYLLYMMDILTANHSGANVTCDRHTLITIKNHYGWKDVSVPEEPVQTAETSDIVGLNYSYTPPPLQRQFKNSPNVVDDKRVHLNCTNGFARCKRLICKLSPLQGNNVVTISIRARIYQFTFLEEFKWANSILLSVNAFWEALDYEIMMKNKSETGSKTLTAEIFNLVKNIERPTENLHLIIAGSVVGGLLILGIILIILYSVGFFRRKQKLVMQTRSAPMSAYPQRGVQPEYSTPLRPETRGNIMYDPLRPSSSTVQTQSIPLLDMPLKTGGIGEYEFDD